MLWFFFIYIKSSDIQKYFLFNLKHKIQYYQHILFILLAIQMNNLNLWMKAQKYLYTLLIFLISQEVPSDIFIGYSAQSRIRRKENKSSVAATRREKKNDSIQQCHTYSPSIIFTRITPTNHSFLFLFITTTLIFSLSHPSIPPRGPRNQRQRFTCAGVPQGRQ